MRQVKNQDFITTKITKITKGMTEEEINLPK